MSASPSPRSGLIVSWKPLLLAINVPIEPGLVQRHDVLSTLMLDGLQNDQKFLYSLESGQSVNVSKPMGDPPKMLQSSPHAAGQITVDSGLRHNHSLRDLTERKKRCLGKHRRNPIVKSETPFKLPDDKEVVIFRSADEFSNVFPNYGINGCILPEHAVDFMCDRKFGPFGLMEEGDDGPEVNHLILTYSSSRIFSDKESTIIRCRVIQFEC
jgi:hypothetical protein